MAKKKQKITEEYESPQAIHLTEKDRAFGLCNLGSIYNIGYRVHEHEGVCVTGKSATSGCYAGVGCADGSGL